MKRTLSTFTLALLLTLASACEDDPETTTTDTSAADTPTDAETDGAADTPDEEVIEGPTCEPVDNTGPENAVYDVFFDAGSDGYYGTAEATRDGLEVTVQVDTETFSGTFREGGNCVPAQAGLLFPLCFLNADGTSAAPETLGATLITGPNGTIGIIGAHRRDVDRSCTVSGAYVLTLSGIEVTPSDADMTRAQTVADDLGGQLMVFQLPEAITPQSVGVMGLSLPRLINPLPIEGESLGAFERDVVLEIEQDVEFAVTIESTGGTFDREAGTVTFDLTLTAEGIGLENTGEAFTITATASGTSN